MKSKWLYIGVAGALGVLGIVWWQTQKGAAPSGAQNAVDPNAQIGGGLPAMGTAPDIGNLLWYNQIPVIGNLLPQSAAAQGSQIGGGRPGAVTAPDIGNMLAYIPGVMSVPQATSVDPYSSDYLTNQTWNYQTTGGAQEFS